MRWLCGLMMFVAASLFTEAALAYGVVGDFGFLFEPLIIQDPSPANKLDTLGSSWAKSSDSNTYRISSSSKKVLYIDEDHLPRFSIGSGTLWSHASTLEDPSRDGWDNLDMFAKLPS